MFPIRGCCRCSAGSARDGNITCVTKSGAHECSWRHRGLALWLSQSSLHPAPWLLASGNACKGWVCRTGLVWLAAGTAHRHWSWRLRHSLAVPVGYLWKWGVEQGTAGDSWSIRGRPPWNVLTKTGGLANGFSWCVLLYFVIPVTILLPRYCYSQLWWL